MTTMSADELIQLSLDEGRTVTEYPSTQEEYDTLLDDLLAAGEEDVTTTEVSGAGYVGAEERGWTTVRSSDGWRVDLIHPPQ